MTPAPLGHEAISASAGSGKTFQLAHRYIRLLAAGVEPDQIAALTFSRKAAGEIFDEIVKYLCEAADSSVASAITSERIDSPAIQPEEFVLLASNENCKIQAMRHKERPIYGTQFHAENWEEPYLHGRQIISNFFSLAGLM